MARTSRLATDLTSRLPIFDRVDGLASDRRPEVVFKHLPAEQPTTSPARWARPAWCPGPNQAVELSFKMTNGSIAVASTALRSVPHSPYDR